MAGGEQRGECVTDHAHRPTRLQGAGEDPAGVLVHRQVLHRAVAARVEHQVVVVRVDLRQHGRMCQHLADALQVGGEAVGPGLAAVDGGAQAALVDRGSDTAGGGDGDQVARLAEDPVRLGEFLGPEAGGVRGAVGQGPVGGAGDDEQNGGHE